MLLIWGFKVRLKTLGNGQFHCLQCGADRTYAHRSARRWFTFFWIPVIPLKELGTLIQCETCGSQYDEAVLTVPTSATLSEHLTNAMRYAVAAMVRRSANAPAARIAAVREMAAAGGAYDDGVLDADLTGTDESALTGWLAHLADSLSIQGKESLLSSAARVGLADGALDEHEQELLRSMGRDLLMTPAHVEGVVSQSSVAPEGHPGTSPD